MIYIRTCSKWNRMDGWFSLMIMMITSNGHFFTQIPHPIHNSSEMYASLLLGATSTHCLPIFTTGQLRLHSFFVVDKVMNDVMIMMMISEQKD